MVKGIYGGDCVEVHSVYIADRGGKQRVAQLVDVESVQWTRVRDDVSEAVVAIRGAACSAQAAILANIEPKRSELVIYRGDERVWEGPVNRVGWHADWVEIAARDVADYVFGRPLSRTWDNSYPNTDTVTGRMEEIIEYELTHTFTYFSDDGRPVVLPAWENLTPPINVLPFLSVHHFPNEARTSAETTPFQMSVGEHLDNFARTGGIDYTVVGRALHIWDVSRNLGQTRTLTEADFFGEVIVTAYGADHASVAFTTADDGSYGGAGGVPTDWKFLQKSGPAGTAFTLVGSSPTRVSIADSGLAAWQGYQYWMTYQPSGTGTNTMRVAASKDGITWKDIQEGNINADTGDAVTAGSWPTPAFAYDDRLWVFFIGTDGHLYRTRTEDVTGDDAWSVKVDLYTPAAGVTLASPSVWYNPDTGLWVLWAVNSTTGALVYMTSTTNELDGSGQWGALNTATIDGNPSLVAIEMRRLAGKWVGVARLSSGGVYMIQTKGATAATGFAIGASAALSTTSGKATFLQRRSDGNLSVWYTDAGVAYRTTFTGPAPDIGAGDQYLDYYGPWTKMFTVYDEDDSNTPTQAELNSQAKRNLTGRSPVPVEVRIPDNSGIRLSHGLTINDLVPGVHMPLLATLNARQLSQMQKLDKLSVTESSDGESIQVVLIPATKEDSDEEEG